MKRRFPITALLLLPVLPACAGNPTLADPREDIYTAELVLSTGHVHILSEVGITVTITNALGHVVTGLESVVVERRSEGSATWRTASELTPEGHSYVGAHMPMSSGDYDLRVMVIRHGLTEAEEVPLADPAMAMMHAARAHVVVDGVRFEFETFPGHIHEGDAAEAKFWIMEEDRGANGVRQPITGITGEIVCEDPGGLHEQHTPIESEVGVYLAMHTWTEAGSGKAIFRFVDADDDVREAAFEFPVAHRR